MGRKDWYDYFGVQYKVGYSQYFQKQHLPPSQTLKFLRIENLSYKISVTYLYKVDNIFDLNPYLGYGYFNDSQWSHSVNASYALFSTKTLHIGSYMKLKFKNVRPKIGITANRILERKISYFDPKKSFNMPLSTFNYIQIQVGCDYRFKKCEVGLEFNKGITYVSMNQSVWPVFSIIDYLIAFTWYPLIKKST